MKINAAPRIGMVVLKTDETVEYESRLHLAALCPRARLLVSRIAVSDSISADSLRAMRGELGRALSLFPDNYDFDVVAYACTSAATVIGEEAVADIIRQHCRARYVTNPLTAGKAALARVGARRIGYLAPYISDVAAAMRDNFQRAGFDIIHHHSFKQQSDRAVAAIAPAHILAALIEQFGDKDIDAVFVACTNLSCADIIIPARRQLGAPVISSNQALLWQILTLTAEAGDTRADGLLLDAPDVV